MSSLVSDVSDDVDDGMTSSLSSDVDCSLTTHDYSVQQINIEPGGQVLDCKVGRDEQTGLPRVEMVFSLNPDISVTSTTDNQSAISSSLTGSGSILHDLDNCNEDDVIITQCNQLQSALVPPMDVTQADPPTTFYRPEMTSSTKVIQIRAVTSSTGVTCQTKVSVCRSEDTTGDAADRPMDVETWEKFIENKWIYRRCLLTVREAVVENDCVAILSLLAFATVLFLLLKHWEPSVLTTFCLAGFNVCLIDLIQISVNEPFSHNPKDEVNRLEWIHSAVTSLDRQLRYVWSELLTLKHDRPLSAMKSTFQMVAFEYKGEGTSMRRVVGAVLTPVVRRQQIHLQRFVKRRH